MHCFDARQISSAICGLLVLVASCQVHAQLSETKTGGACGNSDGGITDGSLGGGIIAGPGPVPEVNGTNFSTPEAHDAYMREVLRRRREGKIYRGPESFQSAQEFEAYVRELADVTDKNITVDATYRVATDGIGTLYIEWSCPRGSSAAPSETRASAGGFGGGTGRPPM